MTRIFNFIKRYLLLFMAVLAVIACVTVCSVSYAEWAVPAVDTFTVAFSTGSWSIGNIDETPGWTDINVANGIYIDGKVVELFVGDESNWAGYFLSYTSINDDGYGDFGLAIKVKKEQTVCFKIDACAFNDYGDALHIDDNLNNTLLFDGEKFKVNEGGIYQLNIQIEPNTCRVQILEGDENGKYINLLTEPPEYWNNGVKVEEIAYYDNNDSETP